MPYACHCGNPNFRPEAIDHSPTFCGYKNATVPPAPEHNGACNCQCGCRVSIEEGPYCVPCAHGNHPEKKA